MPWPVGERADIIIMDDVVEVGVPFTKITTGKDKGKYRSPSGRIYTEAQVKAYYATKGFQAEVQRDRRRKKT